MDTDVHSILTFAKYFRIPTMFPFLFERKPNIKHLRKMWASVFYILRKKVLKIDFKRKEYKSQTYL